MDYRERLAAALGDRYEVDREVGRGGMAIVFRAVDRKHNRDVAVKLLEPQLAAAVGGDRFLREIAIAAKLQHPNIVPVYDSGQSEGLLTRGAGPGAGCGWRRPGLDSEVG